MLYDDPPNSPEATFTQVPNRNPIKPVLFLERKFAACVHMGSVRFRIGFGSVYRGTQLYRRKYFPHKQTKEISFAYIIHRTPPNGE